MAQQVKVFLVVLVGALVVALTGCPSSSTVIEDPELPREAREQQPALSDDVIAQNAFLMKKGDLKWGRFSDMALGGFAPLSITKAINCDRGVKGVTLFYRATAGAIVEVGGLVGGHWQLIRPVCNTRPVYIPFAGIAERVRISITIMDTGHQEDAHVLNVLPGDRTRK